MHSIVIATIKEWNIKNYFSLVETYKDSFKFHLIISPDELTKDYIEELAPKYIFFPHWSWIIPKEIHTNYECIVFHMTDLPFGRGGSPLQNLISQQIYDTKITALRVEEGLDTGDIYLKEPFNIATGSAEDIFTKLSDVVFKILIPKLLTNNLSPKKQIGKPTLFKRRTPAQSNINTIQMISIVKLYDFIRMLDAEGYPKAFIDLDTVKIEFSDVNMQDNKLTGRFEVSSHE